MVGFIGVRAQVADGRICGRFCEKGHWIGDGVLSSIVDKNDGGEMGGRMDMCGSAGLSFLFIFYPVLPVLVCETFAQRVLQLAKWAWADSDDHIPMENGMWPITAPDLA